MNNRIKLNWKKLTVHIMAFIPVVFICSAITLAGSDPNKIDNPIKAESLTEFFDGVVSIVIQIGTIISVLGIMYGGFQYVSAQGDEEKLGSARKTITWALVGTAVLLGARTIMAVVKDTVDQLG